MLFPASRQMHTTNRAADLASKQRDNSGCASIELAKELSEKYSISLTGYDLAQKISGFTEFENIRDPVIHQASYIDQPTADVVRQHYASMHDEQAAINRTRGSSDWLTKADTQPLNARESGRRRPDWLSKLPRRSELLAKSESRKRKTLPSEPAEKHEGSSGMRVYTLAKELEKNYSISLKTSDLADEIRSLSEFEGIRESVKSHASSIDEEVADRVREIYEERHGAKPKVDPKVEAARKAEEEAKRRREVEARRRDLAQRKLGASPPASAGGEMAQQRRMQEIKRRQQGPGVLPPLPPSPRRPLPRPQVKPRPLGEKHSTDVASSEYSRSDETIGLDETEGNDDTINFDETLRGLVRGQLLAQRYELVRKLGRGGMGVVWLAQDRTLRGDPIAIKMLPEAFAQDKDALDNLVEEARIAHRLTHRGIVRLHTYDASPEGIPYLVMEYLRGPSLKEVFRCRRKTRRSRDEPLLSEPELVGLVEQVGRALDFAHRERVIHRDLKPANLMIAQPIANLTKSVNFRRIDVKICDFGIARVLDDTRMHFTTAPAVGTLPYMSPEQIAGRGVGPASDFYSLGCVLYEAMSGHPPFVSGDLAYQHLNVDPKPLTAASLNVERAIMRCLSKRATERFKSSSQLIKALKRPNRGRIDRW